jgi:hypothetical protein
MRRRQFLLTASAALAAGLVKASPASAGRFGPPWMSRVVVDQSAIYLRPDFISAPVEPLQNHDIVVVLGQVTDSTGHEWTQTPFGFVPSNDIAEEINPFVADVTANSTSVYAKPNAADVVRLTSRRGDLLRVTGVSAGIQGDSNLWWSTTEGYVALNDLQPSQNPWSPQWTVPDGLLAPSGWWGATVSSANVRAGPTTEAPTIGRLPGGNLIKVLVEGPGQNVQGSATWYRVDGGRYAGGFIHSSLVRHAQEPQANTTLPTDGAPPDRWIVVDRAAHSLTLVDAGQPTFVTYVALGVAGRATPAGAYTTWGKYRADDMTSASVKDPGGYYDLPNVPDTQYYLDGGYALHGTYWHDEFGTDQSHGCVNVTWTDGRFLFNQTLPRVPPDQLTAPTGQTATPIAII